MSSVENILCNPGSSCIYLNHRFYYAIGNTPAVDLTEGCELPKKPKFLLLGCGDIRNILRTVHEVNDIKPSPKSLSFHLNDIDDVLLARNAVLIQAVNTIDPSKRDDVEFLWNIWYNLELPPGHFQRLRSILSDILENPLGCLNFELECFVAVKKVIKYWLTVNMDVREAKSLREHFMRKKIAADNKNSLESTTFTRVVTDLISSCKFVSDAHDVSNPSQSQRISDELRMYFQTGSTHIVSTDSRTNPTFFCPHINSWRVHPFLLPYVGFEEHLFDDSLSLRENCVRQLQLLVKSWTAYRRNNGIINVSMWYEEALTLCNRTMPDDMKFNFINTSNLCDHINVLNVLLAGSRRLERSGVLSIQPLNWSTGGYSSVEKYLKMQTGIPISFYPTFLGLHLAEDFELGTNKRPKIQLSTAVNEISLRWIAADTCKPGLSISDSPEVVEVLESVAKQCFSMLDSPEADPLNTPLTLVYLMQQLARNIDGGVEPLLDIVERCLPTETTSAGEKFCPLEPEWNVLKAYHLHSQLGEGLTDDLVICTLAMNIDTSSPKPAGIGLSVKAVVTNYAAGFMPFELARKSAQWNMLTVVHYDYRAAVLKYVLPKSTFDTFVNDNPNAGLHLLVAVADSKFLRPLHTGHLGLSEVRYVPRGEVLQKCLKSDDVLDEGDEVDLIITEREAEYQITVKSKRAEAVIQNVTTCTTTLQTKTVRVTCKMGSDGNNINVDMNIRFSCCIEQPFLTRCTRKNSVTFSKSKILTQGPLTLLHRRQIISTYPRYSGSNYKCERLLAAMVSSACDTNRQMEDITDGSALFQVKETLQIFFKYTIDPPAEKPFVQSYALLKKDRPGIKLFGYFPEDIFIGVRGLYTIQGLPTLDVVWLDFEVYRKLVPYKQGIDTEEAVKFLEQNAGSKEETCHTIKVNVEESLLLKKILRVNSFRTVQEIEESPRWRFNSFLQPVYSIEAELDLFEIVTGKAKYKNMGSMIQPVPDPSSQARAHQENAPNQPPRCHRCKISILDMKKCSRCKAVYYCTKSCQQEDWKAGHSKVCREIQPEKDKSVSETNDPEDEPSKCEFCGTTKLGMKKCSRCKVVSYCSKACQIQDWKAGHRSVCHTPQNN